MVGFEFTLCEIFYFFQYFSTSTTGINLFWKTRKKRPDTSFKGSMIFSVVTQMGDNTEYLFLSS
ncbi:hypothetical protein, partial [Enterococcus cecorum]|uniref:hypothetical protein n=1 Tax=Enterococcus cecorum TaxID=44008 RepID=UPI001AEBA7D4